ncbi:Tc toxin subunit A [Wolbachia endosymbiont of Oryzaephilus surinamensis]|uniref:Tc toxin subunit A n=1 Tax=Wolbachia endosymbiont of Oryzaephilus surinamensis TaxID=573241 RepID=UPI0021D52243|nr:Tc toxin subunit A [Wolbachia endosymbiont of Oryzaephilus surinamensis]UXX40869.1 Tc toxin subunit A [Wolbachia endosymbiont of Oryzaephilus surinamensis]
MTKIVENTFGTENVYSECDDCQSVLSPAAYFVKLMETVEKYIKPNTLNSRRPDLENIKLDCDNTNKEKLYLEVANQIMEEKLKKESKGNILQKLATAKYPFNLPANFPLIGIRAYLKEHDISLAEMYKILIKDADTTAESLHLSPEAYHFYRENRISFKRSIWS